MRNKKFTYLLFVCVAGIWGVIIYRLVAGDGDNAIPITRPASKMAIANQEIDHTRQPSRLKPLNRDPFSGIVTRPDTLIAVKRNRPKIAATPEWPAITYTGYVQGNGTKRKLALLSISGVDKLLSQGEAYNGVKLLKNYGDSVQVAFAGQARYINIKK